MLLACRVGRGPSSRPSRLASVLYAFCGYGRGHLSRALAVSAALRGAGHEVTFRAGGPAYAALRALGEPVEPVPALQQVIAGNRVRFLATARANAPHAVGTPETTAALAAALREARPDLVVSDLEPFVHRAAQRVGVPVVSLSHQQVLTEARCTVPVGYRPSAAATALGVRILVPRRPARVVVPTFFFPPVRRPERAVLVPPVLRPDVRALRPSAGKHVLVYLNEGTGCEPLLKTLRAVDALFVVYGAAPVASPEAYPNLRFRTPSSGGFLRDLAACRAVVTTAGFTLLSEALYLGKPILALPNRGFFEQVLNALYLRASGRGDAVLGRLPGPAEIATFLTRFDGRLEQPFDGDNGDMQVVCALEDVLAGGPSASRPS